MPNRPPFASIAVTAPLFAVAGGVSRDLLRMTETRWQIVAFALLAAGVEGLARLRGAHRASLLRGTINAAAAAIAIVSMKLYVEPAARTEVKATAHAAATLVLADPRLPTPMETAT